MASLPALDPTDRMIIALLQQDGRLSNKALAAEVGIAPSTCSERVQRLRDNGVFRGFHGEVEPEALGIGLQALVVVRLRRHAEDLVHRFWEHTEEMPEVKAVYHLSGGNDFLCHVVVKDSDHLRRVAVSGFTSLPEVAHIETSLIFEHRAKPSLPDLTEE
ncbi:MAG: Lrp/AsnC family transcriptional regulator [Acidimicrobiia bacterium]|nr:Lrp/AsnC family transcriptional regulator [Acidimicrobiia bacterium]